MLDTAKATYPIKELEDSLRHQVLLHAQRPEAVLKRLLGNAAAKALDRGQRTVLFIQRL